MMKKISINKVSIMQPEISIKKGENKKLAALIFAEIAPKYIENSLASIEQVNETINAMNNYLNPDNDIELFIPS